MNGEWIKCASMLAIYIEKFQRPQSTTHENGFAFTLFQKSKTLFCLRLQMFFFFFASSLRYFDFIVTTFFSLSQYRLVWYLQSVTEWCCGTNESEVCDEGLRSLSLCLSYFSRLCVCFCVLFFVLILIIIFNVLCSQKRINDEMIWTWFVHKFFLIHECMWFDDVDIKIESQFSFFFDQFMW